MPFNGRCMVRSLTICLTNDIVQIMKRSKINESILLAKSVFAERGISLPPFAFWTPDEWRNKGPECDEIRDCMLGWDVTDFGGGDFAHIGRILFTLRNGSAGNSRYKKVYAEKVILDPEGQRAPAHFHVSKMEDIICVKGSVLLELSQADEAGNRSDAPFTVQVDGRTVNTVSGGIVRITAGESICLPPRTIHQFWGEEGKGISISREVSSVCDDLSDNCFLEKRERFPAVEEDEPPVHLLCKEYPR